MTDDRATTSPQRDSRTKRQKRFSAAKAMSDLGKEYDGNTNFTSEFYGKKLAGILKSMWSNEDDINGIMEYLISELGYEPTATATPTTTAPVVPPVVPIAAPPLCLKLRPK